MMAHFELFRQDHDTQDFAAGATIFNAGDAGEHLYIIQTGAVEIQFAGQPLTVLGEGEALGEMGVIHPGSPRSATAIAKTDCRLVVIDQKRFTFLVQQHPYFAIEIMKTLAERLTRTTQKLEG
ncbi:cyclic nucleotide-binding domain protein [[Synechococcus] sp. NIES-970]|uniref:Crp/Fnr family transcriptional regulator n=1 Tax=Picosynechococcus sp. NKBG15041c TaxID=1407650 RepID=UPI00041078A4|nr:cyclic nucleotide-binding domain-containing protein [Picosynechococcus sp. NKBG15041c]BAW96493.1 cyclic nucleotide-binding domain protein [[Synechococcus] sp. NIES-970]